MKGEWRRGRGKTRLAPATRGPHRLRPRPLPVTALVAAHVDRPALVRPQGRCGLGDEVLPGPASGRESMRAGVKECARSGPASNMPYLRPLCA